MAINLVLSLDYLQALKAVASAVDRRSPATIGHAHKAAFFAKMISFGLRMSEEEVEEIRIAADLHDVGMSGVDSDIFLKEGELEAGEYEKVKTHPLIGAALCKPMASSTSSGISIPEAVLFHHERFDGEGYPQGLRGEKIPLAARIIAVAERFVALTSARSYRPALGYPRSRKLLEEEASSALDPQVVEAFVEVLDRDLLTEEKCFEIKGCPPEIKDACPASKSLSFCWELREVKCALHGDKSCQACLVYTFLIEKNRV